MKTIRSSTARMALIVATAMWVTACNELTVDEPLQVNEIDIRIACRAEVADSFLPGGSFCQMSVGEVDTLSLTVLADSVSVTGLRVSWIADRTALSIRTLDNVLDSAEIDTLSPSEFLSLQLRAEVVALKRGTHEVRFTIDSAGFFTDDDTRASFEAFLRDEGFFFVKATERWFGIAAGEGHTCALTYDDTLRAYDSTFAASLRPGGEAFCWGEGFDGALGTGSFSEVIPTDVLTDERFRLIFAGGGNTCAIDLKQLVWCWGGNEFGQLGTGNQLDQFAPRLLALGIPFSDVAVGNEFTCGVPRGRNDALPEQTRCWGRNVEGQLGCDEGDPGEPCFAQGVADGEKGNLLVPSEDVESDMGEIFFEAVASGARHACGLVEVGAVEQGTAWCWGDNTFEPLGVPAGAPVCQKIGATEADTISFPCRRVAVQAQGPGGGAALAFQRITAGGEFTCAVTDAVLGGPAYCWGRNDQGQLGDGTSVDSDEPVQVSAGSESFASITAGAVHACALTPAGSAYCWGANLDGQLGDGTTVSKSQPVAVTGGLTFVFIAAGDKHTCGVVSDPVSVVVPADTLISPDSTRLVASGGPIYCWGEGVSGQLGTGAAEGSTSPVRITEPLF